MRFRFLFLIIVLMLGLVATARTADAADVRMFVRHEVNDYAAWRKVYDDFDDTRRKLGVTDQAVYWSVDNRNDVTVTHDFRGAEQAKAFAASPDLKSAMERGGVKGTPAIWFTTKAAK
jgi:hypothetical protein